MNEIDSMLWTTQKLPDSVFNELRLSAVVHTGLLVRDAWVNKDGKIGLPRAWAKQRGFTGLDSTLCPRVDWPVPRLTWRYNQQEVVECSCRNVLANGGCLIAAPPGFGKTVVSLSVASRLQTSTLVLVNKEDLIDQWKATARTFFGLEAGHVQEDRLDYEHEVTIATVQTLNARMDRLPESFWRYFGFVICDEGHRMPCDTFVRVISKLPARYRLAVSATWRRKDGMEKMWEFHISDKICEGQKNDVQFQYQPISLQTTLTDRDFMFRGEINHVRCLTAIARNEGYNNWLVETVLGGIATRNILVVSHRLEQLERLDSLLRLRGVTPGIYVGTWKGKKVSQQDLERASEAKVILATAGKIGEGSDIPRLDTVILATPCTDPEQIVGRVGRAYPGKDFALVIDPIIAGSFYCAALYRKRENHYVRLGFQRI
jgi:superfamily II DNA or RNA helicase